MNHVLGIDGGGTSTVCLLADADGRVVAQVEAPASNHRKTDLRDARDALHAGISSLARLAHFDERRPLPVAAACAGLAGVDTADDERELRDVLRELIATDRLQVLNDGEIAVAGALEDEPGVLIISGTGSIAWATARDKRRLRVGGWDYVMSDEGSGYCIGARVLRAVTAAHDRRRAPTILTERVFEFFGAANFYELLNAIYNQEMTPQRIASLAPLADRAAEEGDRAARRVLEEAAGELVELVTDAAKLADLSATKFPVVPMGGALLGGGTFAETFYRTLAAAAPDSHVVRPRRTPAEGAVLLALKAVGEEGAGRPRADLTTTTAV